MKKVRALETEARVTGYFIFLFYTMQIVLFHGYAVTMTGGSLEKLVIVTLMYIVASSIQFWLNHVLLIPHWRETRRGIRVLKFNLETGGGYRLGSDIPRCYRDSDWS